MMFVPRAPFAKHKLEPHPAVFVPPLTCSAHQYNTSTSRRNRESNITCRSLPFTFSALLLTHAMRALTVARMRKTATILCVLLVVMVVDARATTSSDVSTSAVSNQSNDCMQAFFQQAGVRSSHVTQYVANFRQNGVGPEVLFDLRFVDLAKTRLALRMQVIRSASILVSLVEVGVWCSLSAITRGLVSIVKSHVNTIASASTSIPDQDVPRKSRIPWRS